MLCDKKQYTPEQYTGQDRVDGVALLKTKIMRVYNKRGYEASQKIKQEAIDPPVKATTGVWCCFFPTCSYKSSVTIMFGNSQTTFAEIPGWVTGSNRSSTGHDKFSGRE